MYESMLHQQLIVGPSWHTFYYFTTLWWMLWFQVNIDIWYFDILTIICSCWCAYSGQLKMKTLWILCDTGWVMSLGWLEYWKPRWSFHVKRSRSFQKSSLPCDLCEPDEHWAWHTAYWEEHTCFVCNLLLVTSGHFNFFLIINLALYKPWPSCSTFLRIRVSHPANVKKMLQNMW